MKPYARRFAPGLLLAGLTLGTFSWGAHLGANHDTGRDLLRGPRTTERPQHGLTFAALGPGRARVAADSETDGSSDPAGADSPATIFDDVYALLKRNYVDGVPSDTKLAHGAAAAMVASLQDYNSRFLEPAEMAAVSQEAQGVYHGIGAVTSVRKFLHPKIGDAPEYTEFRLTLVAAIPGGPADKAGLRAGDVITHINAQWIAGYDPALAQYKSLKALTGDPVSFNRLADAIEKQEKSAITLNQAQSQVRDSSTKRVVLTIQRPGVKASTVTLETPLPTEAPAVTGRLLSGGIGYVRVTQFTDATAGQLDDVLGTFGTGPKGLIVDLRDSPGGLLDAASSAASRLTAQETLGFVEGRGKKRTPLTLTPRRTFACPVAVLINGGTSSASELLAAAMRQDGAKLIGAQTFGDASDVKPVALKDGSGFTMTIGQMKPASGVSFAGIGIKPDVPVADTAGEEPINRALEMLSGRVARVPSHGG